MAGIEQDYVMLFVRVSLDEIQQLCEVTLVSENMNYLKASFSEKSKKSFPV
jgi:hypothetical protein